MEIVKNKEKNGIELYFNEKPENAVLRLLKDNHFRWHNAKRCWYIKYSELAMQVVELIKNGNVKNVSRETLQKKTEENYLGVKVGDIFEMSWGYEQTNIDFFEVVALKGKTQVVIKEVALEVDKEEGISGMSRDVSFKTNKTRILDRSVFIKDNEKGMIKKVCGTKENPYLSFDYGLAKKYHGQKLYESWYY